MVLDIPHSQAGDPGGACCPLEQDSQAPLPSALNMLAEHGVQTPSCLRYCPGSHDTETRAFYYYV